MSLQQVVALWVGFAFFLVVAMLNGVMALALGFAHPLMALWILVPVPLIFLLIFLWPLRSRAIRIFAFSYLLMCAFLTVILWGGGWYLSDILKDGALVIDHTPPQVDLEVAAIEDDQVTFFVTTLAKADDLWTRDGIWGLERNNAYDQVGAILEINDHQVVREYLPISGDLKIGEMVRLDSWAFPGDPQKAFDITFQQVVFTSPLGEFPAWLVDGPSTTWVIFVHGKGAEPGQALRILPTVNELGLPFLVITYRNDSGVPANPDGFYRYGQTELEDLEGAARYALEHGAEEVIMVGYSMGGAIIANFLYESPLSDRVSGLILDSPMLNFSTTIDMRARQRGYPRFVATIGKAVSSFRFGVNWGSLDYLKNTDELSVPILLFHSDEDAEVPIKTSDALAEARPDLVKYVRIANAPHVSYWNIDPAAYEAAVREFLRGLTQ